MNLVLRSMGCRATDVCRPTYLAWLTHGCMAGPATAPRRRQLAAFINLVLDVRGVGPNLSTPAGRG